MYFAVWMLHSYCIWSAIKQVPCIQIKNSFIEWGILMCDTKLLYSAYLSRTMLSSGSVGRRNPPFWGMLLIRFMVGCWMVGICSPCFHACVSYLCLYVSSLGGGWTLYCWSGLWTTCTIWSCYWHPISIQRYLKNKQTIKQNF